MQIGGNTPAVVTGGASGLGEASARALAGQGAKVAIFDVNDEDGPRVAEELGGIFVKTDVTSDESVMAALAAAREAHGQERICVNCAGIAPAARTVGREGPHPMALFQTVVDVNLVGTMRVMSFSAAGMVEAEPLNDSQERGIIVNTAS
ncbi:MAG: SDR family NAD(P)-dependent oxidoreductase, partial [Pseudomonadota bacterium]